MRAVKFLFLAVMLLVGCTPRPSDVLVADLDASTPDSGLEAPDAGPTCGCELWGNARNDGTIEAPLVELSGLVASRSQPGVFFAHNDSGDTARFFAISIAGQVLQTFELGNATAVDWEDIALGPCGTGTCLYLGDIGDNGFVRTDYAVYQVTEPHVTSGTATVGWERYPFEYPAGAKHNAESMFMNAQTGRLYVVTKNPSAVSEVYRFPLPMDSTRTATLEKVATLTIPGTTDQPLTAADVNVCGTGVLMRMYNRLVEYRLPPGETNFERIFSVDPVTVPFANEPQGEAVAYGPDGRTYFTSSEKLVDAPPLYEFRCR